MSSGYVFTERYKLDSAVNLWILSEAYAIQTYGDINTWDVSAITDFSSLFNSTIFNSDISNWDVSSGTDFSVMFWGVRLYSTRISAAGMLVLELIS